jgi:hypothetical protein
MRVVSSTANSSSEAWSFAAAEGNPARMDRSRGSRIVGSAEKQVGDHLRPLTLVDGLQQLLRGADAPPLQLLADLGLKRFP